MKKPITSLEEDASASRPRLYGIILLVAAIGFSGLWLVNRVAWMDAARDNRHWQDKLNLIVESRAMEVSGWVKGHFKELRSLAENPSMQLYLTELEVAPPRNNDEVEPAQKTYIRNLLSFVADRMGITSPTATAQTIGANVMPENPGGIAIVDNEGRTIVSTAMAPPQKSIFAKAIESVPKGGEGLLDIERSEDGKLMIGFVLPVYGLQGNQDAQSQIGRVIALLPVDESLFDLLRHPGVTEKTLEVGLLRAQNGQVQYLSPLMDNSKPLEKTMADEEKMWAESFALHSPGGFEVRLDYRTQSVFVTSRTIAETPWTVIAKIDRQEALAESTVRRNGMVAMLMLALIIVVITIIMVWRQTSLKRSQLLSRRFKMLADRASAQEQLLRLVTDNQPESVFIIDAETHYQFANSKAAEKFGMSAGSMRGKRAVDVMGASRAGEVIRSCEEAMNRNNPVVEMRREGEGGAEKVIRAEHIPLAHIPVATLPEGTPGVLVVEQDVSELVHERERRLSDHQKLIETLIMLVDKRDPNAAHHSAQVSFVAGKVAESLQLDNFLRDTTRLAGSLMNIGKIVISEQVLTRADSLNAEEKRSIRESIYASADVLSGIPFDGPVVETLRQSQEQWDGSGPKGMKGENILLPARIIAVANAFVGMISKRAYRDAITMDEAIKMMLSQVDRQYDRRVVVALADYIENKGGRSELEGFVKQSRKAA